MTLKERVIDDLEKRRLRALNGELNCIPFPFPTLRLYVPGIEKGTYYLMSGATKAGKTQITSYMFLYNTVLYYHHHKDKIVPKIFYFPLEETAELITLRFMAYILSLLTKGKLKLSINDLRSTNENFPLDEEVLNLMKTEQFNDIMNTYESVVSFYDDRNPTGILKTLIEYAENHGETIRKDVIFKDKFGKEYTKNVFDHYIPINPDEYVIIIIDHISLISPERGMDLRESINLLSKYLTQLRNNYAYIPVVVQQQSVGDEIILIKALYLI